MSIYYGSKEANQAPFRRLIESLETIKNRVEGHVIQQDISGLDDYHFCLSQAAEAMADFIKQAHERYSEMAADFGVEPDTLANDIVATQDYIMDALDGGCPCSFIMQEFEEQGAA